MRKKETAIILCVKGIIYFEGRGMKLDSDKSGGLVPVAAELLRRELPGLKLVLDKPYRELTTLGVGGTLPVLAEPADEAELAKLLKFLKRRNIRFFILGGGSNLVGMDDPYSGVGIRLDRAAFGEMNRDGDTIHVGAMAKLPALAEFAASEGLHGFSALAGIPGCVGGALRMNASCRGVAIGELVTELRGVRFNGKPWSAPAKKLKWRYREGGAPEDVVLTSAVFKLAPGSPDEELAALEAERAKRRETEPSGRSAGCVFRNFSPEEPAGMLIDRCGLRGAKVGGVEVSEKHANYIVNASGTASERDFLTLARLVRRTVRERFGRELRPEVRFIRDVSARQLAKDWAPPATGGGRLTVVLFLVCRYMFQIASLMAGASLAAVGVKILRIDPSFGSAILALAALLFAGVVLTKWMGKL